MNPRDVALVRESFALLEPVAEQAAAQFYDRVFERSPDVATLFRGNMVHQGSRLMTMIGAAVGLLDNMHMLERLLLELGRRHVGYGVQAAHYEVVGGALLDTLAAALGPAYKPEHRLAWATLYGHISRCMQRPLPDKTGGLNPRCGSGQRGCRTGCPHNRIHTESEPCPDDGAAPAAYSSSSPRRRAPALARSLR